MNTNCREKHFFSLQTISTVSKDQNTHNVGCVGKI